MKGLILGLRGLSFGPKRTDYGSERADLGPERGRGDRWTYGRTDGRLEIHTKNDKTCALHFWIVTELLNKIMSISFSPQLQSLFQNPGTFGWLVGPRHHDSSADESK